tara:strand:- start:498 stop:905 length:408 start_codon:yes stop_codon:yes gene_type:complete
MVIGNPCLENGCSICCRNTQMPLTNDDAKRISTKSGLKIDEFAVRNNGFLQLYNNPKTNACVFLNTNSNDILAPGICSIHDFRPEGCRIYPIIINENEKITTDDLCPQHTLFSININKFKTRLLNLDNQIEKERN